MHLVYFVALNQNWFFLNSEKLHPIPSSLMYQVCKPVYLYTNDISVNLICITVHSYITYNQSKPNKIKGEAVMDFSYQSLIIIRRKLMVYTNWFNQKKKFGPNITLIIIRPDEINRLLFLSKFYFFVVLERIKNNWLD